MVSSICYIHLIRLTPKIDRLIYFVFITNSVLGSLLLIMSHLAIGASVWNSELNKYCYTRYIG